MTYLNLNAQVYLDGVDITDYIMEIRRTNVLCNVVQTFTLQCDKSLLDFLNSIYLDLKPSNTMVIYELGVKVLTGHVRSIQRSRKPDYTLEISGTDKYKLAKDYFIDNDEFPTSNGESVIYWVERLLDLAGLSLIVDTPSLAQFKVAPGIEFKFRTVDDALNEVIAYASAYLYVDPDGIVHLQKGATSSGLYFTGGKTTQIDDKIHPLGNNVKKASYEISDDMTRNVVKVWGTVPEGTYLQPGQSSVITTTSSVNLGMPVDKTVVYSSNLIQTYAEAERLSKVILTDLAKFDKIKRLETVGNPNIKIGHNAFIDVDLESSKLYETAYITGVTSELSKNGYTMVVVFDEFCPRFAGWQISVVYPILYAGTDGYGVYKSENLGASWTAFNAGLVRTPGFGNLFADRLAFDASNKGMGIINNRLYYCDGNEWTFRYTPTLSSGASLPLGIVATISDTYPIAVDSAGVGLFYLLTSAPAPSGFLIPSGTTFINNPYGYVSFLNTTSDYGITWTTEVVTDNPDVKENYNYRGIDLNSSGGFPNLIVSKYVPEVPPPPGLTRVPFILDLDPELPLAYYSRNRSIYHQGRPQALNDWSGTDGASLINFPLKYLNYTMGLKYPTRPIMNPEQVLNVNLIFEVPILGTWVYPVYRNYRIGFLWGSPGIMHQSVFCVPNLPYANLPTEAHPQGSWIDVSGGAQKYGQVTATLQIPHPYLEYLYIYGEKLRFSAYYSASSQTSSTSIYENLYFIGESARFTHMYDPYDIMNDSPPMPEEDGYGNEYKSFGNYDYDLELPWPGTIWQLKFGIIKRVSYGI